MQIVTVLKKCMKALEMLQHLASSEDIISDKTH